MRRAVTVGGVEGIAGSRGTVFPVTRVVITSTTFTSNWFAFVHASMSMTELEVTYSFQGLPPTSAGISPTGKPASAIAFSASIVPAGVSSPTPLASRPSRFG